MWPATTLDFLIIKILDIFNSKATLAKFIYTVKPVL